MYRNIKSIRRGHAKNARYGQIYIVTPKAHGSPYLNQEWLDDVTAYGKLLQKSSSESGYLKKLRVQTTRSERRINRMMVNEVVKMTRLAPSQVLDDELLDPFTVREDPARHW